MTSASTRKFSLSTRSEKDHLSFRNAIDHRSLVLLAGRCQSAKWQVAVGFAWLADGTRENGDGSWLSACLAMSDLI